jgi:hypothetical protein
VDGTEQAGQHTPYQDVTIGFWWARYEGFEYRGDWIPVEVWGTPPLLHVREAGASPTKFIPLLVEVSYGNVHALWFYNRIEGPPVWTE